MPYTNILWIKLEKRLLNDYRFYTMSEFAQLTYIKLLLIAAETDNKVPKNPSVLQACMRSSRQVSEIEDALNEIRANFPKIKETAQYLYFLEWRTRHNQVRPKASPGLATGYERASTDKIREEKNRIEKNRIEKRESTPAQEAKTFFDNPEPTIQKLIDRGLPETIVRSEVTKFISYWTELNKSGTRQRWELEKTFELGRRIATWFSRIKSFNQLEEVKGIRL